MSTSSPHVKKVNGEGKKTKRTASDSESDSDETSPKSAALNSDKSQTTILKEIKATFDFKGPGDFQKIRILGKGGVGRVYLVQLKGTDKLFAMKVLKQEEMISRNKVRTLRTLSEASNLLVFAFGQTFYMEKFVYSNWKKQSPFRYFKFFSSITALSFSLFETSFHHLQGTVFLDFSKFWFLCPSMTCACPL